MISIVAGQSIRALTENSPPAELPKKIVIAANGSQKIATLTSSWNVPYTVKVFSLFKDKNRCLNVLFEIVKKFDCLDIIIISIQNSPTSKPTIKPWFNCMSTNKNCKLTMIIDLKIYTFDKEENNPENTNTPFNTLLKEENKVIRRIKTTSSRLSFPLYNVKFAININTVLVNSIIMFRRKAEGSNLSTEALEFSEIKATFNCKEEITTKIPDTAIAIANNPKSSGE